MTEPTSINFFAPSEALSALFQREYNGSRLTQALRPKEMQLTLPEAVSKLQEVVEDGLIGAFSALSRNSQPMSMADVDSAQLATAFNDRLPLAHKGIRAVIALRLRDELRETLADGKTLQIDGGSVSYANKRWQAVKVL